ncbi:DUF4376 domain-containing protein [Brucella pituitosa]|uniref:DUF4376 domain-containing protein n=1 Tax=Brucella pituitosa TaxID=571256 RepID=UPI003F4AB154
MQATQQVIDMERMGKKGTLIHPEAYGEQPPMKTVPVVDDKPDTSHPGLTLPEYAAAKRWEKEVGGIEVNGAIIDTSRDSQNMITGAYNYAQENPSKMVSFKTASGWVRLSATEVTVIAIAVGDHVQALFDLESVVADQIEAGIITTIGQIDAAFA